MKTVVIAAAGFVALALPAFAQTPNPTANATTLGTATTSGNAAGSPSASTPAGQVATTGGASVAPAAVPSAGGAPTNQAINPTADSSTTGTTTPK